MKFPHPMRRKDDRPDRRLRRGLYILPSLFTAANIAAGYYALVQITQGSPSAPQHFNFASIAIGFAVMFDSLDGAIARMTNTSSDFGRELDSLADVVTFGVAPAMLAFFWGFHFLHEMTVPAMRIRMVDIGMAASFVFLMAGASRLARFNIQVNPEPSNPGRPGKKYFVGMPIPAAAGVLASVVHFSKGQPVEVWWQAVLWCGLMVACAFFMVSTWRFFSTKGLKLRSRHPFRVIVVVAAVLAGAWEMSRPFLLVLAMTYMCAGILWRLQWVFRKKNQPQPPFQEASRQEASQPS
jgi:CDP-diacylglycerol---serine O-phosphatidyltransferase